MKLLLFRLGVVLVAWILAFALPAGVLVILGGSEVAVIWIAVGLIFLAALYVMAIVLGVMILFEVGG